MQPSASAGSRLCLQQLYPSRQALVGSHYGLLADYSYHPNPDYYTLLLWKRLMGAGVLGVSIQPISGAMADGVDELHVYAHCTVGGGGVTLAFINISPNRWYTVDIDLMSRGLDPPRNQSIKREEYHIVPDAGLYGRRLAVNGQPLELEGDVVPRPPPVLVDAATPLSVAPTSLGFAAVRVATAACGPAH